MGVLTVDRRAYKRRPTQPELRFKAGQGRYFRVSGFEKPGKKNCPLDESQGSLKEPTPDETRCEPSCSWDPGAGWQQRRQPGLEREAERSPLTTERSTTECSTPVSAASAKRGLDAGNGD